MSPFPVADVTVSGLKGDTMAPFAMDGFSVPMEKPAADFDSVAEADLIRQRVQMKEIIRSSSWLLC